MPHTSPIIVGIRQIHITRQLLRYCHYADCRLMLAASAYAAAAFADVLLLLLTRYVCH